MTTQAERERRAKLLERRIAESGLSAREFAEEVLLTSERSVRRWLDRTRPVSNVVLDFLEDPRPRAWPPPDWPTIECGGCGEELLLEPHDCPYEPEDSHVGDP